MYKYSTVNMSLDMIENIHVPTNVIDIMSIDVHVHVDVNIVYM